MSEQFQMSDRFPMQMAASTQHAELIKYCKMENVPLAVLLRADKPRGTVKLRLKSTTFHLLQWIDKRLDVMINRLSTEVEPSGLVQSRLA
jgi:hypothetical protein